MPTGYGFGPFPLPYQEIEAYSRLMRRDLRPFEVEVIRGISESYCEVYYKKVKNKQGVPDGVKLVKMDDKEGLLNIFSNAGTRKK